MEKVEDKPFSLTLRNYFLVTKPGIIFGNSITAMSGFALGARGNFSLFLFLAMIVGVTTIIGSACVFNNYIDREMDKKMARTKNRPLPRGAISSKHALVFATILGVTAIVTLFFLTNLLTTVIALFGFIVYVVFYTRSKYRSVHGTFIGSFAGALPPMIGYVAVSNRIDGAALIFFMMIFLWQMPHFFAITLYRIKEYGSAAIPVMPIVKGLFITKLQMALYIVAFIIVSSMLAFFRYVNYFYFVPLAVVASLWLLLAMRGFTSKNDVIWGRKMFIFSLIVVMTLSLTIPFTVQ